MALTRTEYTGGATGWAGAGAYHGTDYAMVVISSNAAVDQAHTILWISAPGQGEYTSPKTPAPLYNNGIGAHYNAGDLPETKVVGGVTFKFLYIICEYNQYTDAAPITNFYLNVLLPTLGLSWEAHWYSTGMMVLTQRQQYHCYHSVPLTGCYSVLQQTQSTPRIISSHFA